MLDNPVTGQCIFWVFQWERTEKDEGRGTRDTRLPPYTSP
jgi:hypothetical protein